MKKTFYSSWLNANLVIAVAAIGIFYVSVNRHPYNIVGILVSVASVLWLIYWQYGTYVSFIDGRFLVNSEGKIANRYQIPVSSILYVARTPQFVFRSWGGRMMIFFNGDNGKVVQTSVIESSYTHETLREILKMMVEINPRIELDDEYAAFVAKYDPNSIAQLKSTPPLRTMKEIETYVASKYGRP